MKRMKSCNPAKVMAKAAMACSKMSANSRCVFIYHQPKMPDSMRKLKKS